MGRELKRKENRKNKNIKKQEELDTTIRGITIVKVIGVVVLVLLVLYYILAVFVTKELDVSGGDDNNSSENSNSASTSSVSNKILASNIFNQKESTYYVYFYDFSDEDNSISSVIGNKSDMEIYRVDTGSSLNSKYVTEDSGNVSAKDLSDLKVKNPTLIEVTNSQITKYYEGSSNIISFLEQ